jgi:hypothetical protein
MYTYHWNYVMRYNLNIGDSVSLADLIRFPDDRRSEENATDELWLGGGDLEYMDQHFGD